MTDDIDVEAMLEAPFRQESKENGRESSKKSSKKSSSRHRSRSRDRDRKRSRHHRSRSRDRGRRRSSRDRSRRRSRDRRSRSKERKSKDRRSRSYSRERRERLGLPDEPLIPKERSPSPPDRDARTVFCMQLSQRIRSRDLEDFFSAVGTVRDVKLIADKHSKRSKGIAYVEFKEMESVPLALGLSGQKLLGVPMIVQPSQAEKNRVAAAAASNMQRAAALGPTKLYVSELHQNITEEMLKGIFSPFGRLENVQLIRQQDTASSSGSGFIVFHEADAAKKAMEQLNGFEIAGKAMRVTTVTDPSVNPQFAFSMIGGQGGPSFLDNEVVERGGIDLGTTGRLQLMAKLAEGTGLQVPQVAQNAMSMGASMGLGLRGTASGAGAPPAAPQDSSNPPIATTCFQLTNMFDPKNETEPDWKDDIRDDVIDECSQNGKVLHVFVDENSEGNVYVKCDSSEAAAKSVSSLHGRYFAGKMITAAYVPVVNYHALFPDSLTASIPLKPSGR